MIDRPIFLSWRGCGEMFMSIRSRSMVLIMIALLLLVGCKAESETSIQPTTLAQVYPGSIMDADKIELVDGSSGERKAITERKEIQDLLAEIQDMEWIPEEDQEGVVGYLFGIGLFQGEEKKLRFTPTSINDSYYKPNEQLEKAIREWFEKKFEREF
ncbi:hypothetical protein [Cohnella lupini]|uniref:Uncharacterized protein n=1 Tax=Cohnella lupini TaxID=1294267 RepID=A0A3D9IC08_9BACL|nr:hypothetical protein [Cohnella lupini]RED59185.1 hypothetical protein DFP95_10723 [Cohnella lupini]